MILDLTIKVTLLLVLAIVANAAVRNKPAAVRHRIWCLAFCGLLGLPLLTALLPGWRLPILPRIVETSITSESNEALSPMDDFEVVHDTDSTVIDSNTVSPMETPPTLGDELANFDPASVSQADQPPPPQTNDIDADLRPAATSGFAWFRWLGLVWFIGLSVSAWPLIAGAIRNRRLDREATEVCNDTDAALVKSLSHDLNLNRSVRLMKTGRSIIPMTWGILRPVLLFPVAWNDWTMQRRRLVLLHELAHVKRFDVGFQLIACLACVLYWFHPLAWYALKRLRVERELACDDCVLMAGARPSEYAKELLGIAKGYQVFPLATAVAMAQSTSLEQRIRSLLDAARSHLPMGRVTSHVLLVTTIVLVPGLAVFQPSVRSSVTDTGIESVDESRTSSTLLGQIDIDNAEIIDLGTINIDADPETWPKPVRVAAVDSEAQRDVQRISGQVIGPDGKALRYAQIWEAGPARSSQGWTSRPSAVRWSKVAVSQADGRFEYTRMIADSSRQSDSDQPMQFRLAATAPGLGLAFTDLDASSDNRDVRLQLPKDLSIEGRFISADGTPVSGVSVSIVSVRPATNVDPDRLIRSARQSSGVYTNWLVWTGIPPGRREKIVSDEDGRFRIGGLGTQRHVRLQAAGAGIAACRLSILTYPTPEELQPHGTIAVREGLAESEYFASFTHVVQDGRIVRGTVTDAESGDPVSGVRVTAEASWVSRENPAITGEDGRYVIHGVPAADRSWPVRFEAQESLYFNHEHRSGTARSSQTTQLDVALAKGIPVHGHVIDADTGAPISGTVI